MDILDIRIDDLPPVVSATRSQEVAAMEDGAAVKLTVGQILDLILGSAPGQLDTLEELAAALNDDADFAATITASVALKAPLESPTFSGVPAVPDAAPGTNTTQAANTAFVVAAIAAAIAALSVPVFTKAYVSPAQTITAAGSPTPLVHGLGGTPKLVQVLLKCTTAEANYSVGDEVLVNGMMANAANYGVSIVPGTTTISIRYGAVANVFYVLDKTTGVITNITLANWRLIVKAWA